MEYYLIFNTSDPFSLLMKRFQDNKKIKNDLNVKMHNIQYHRSMYKVNRSIYSNSMDFPTKKRKC